jgi:hypothetical protein
LFKSLYYYKSILSLLKKKSIQHLIDIDKNIAHKSCRLIFIFLNVIFMLILQILITCVFIVWKTWNGLASDMCGINVFIMQIDYVKILCKKDVYIFRTNFIKKLEWNSHETTNRWKTIVSQGPWNSRWLQQKYCKKKPQGIDLIDFWFWLLH